MAETIYEIDPGPSIFKRVLNQLLHTHYSDTPILGLIFLIIFIYYAFFKFRHSLMVLTILFLVSTVMISRVPYINSYLSENWISFKFTKNYFDQDGIFLFTFIIIPFATLSILIIINLFIEICLSTFLSSHDTKSDITEPSPAFEKVVKDTQ